VYQDHFRCKIIPNICTFKRAQKTYGLICAGVSFKESIANDVINVSLFACCEPRHRRVETSSVGLSRRWRLTFWTLFMIATLRITMSKWQHCKFDNWRWLFSVLLCCERKWAKNNSVLTEKCCYLNLRSKVSTQLRLCAKFYYSCM